MDNLVPKSFENEVDMSRDEGRSEEDDNEEKPKKTEEKTKNAIDLPQLTDMIEEIMGPDV